MKERDSDLREAMLRPLYLCSVAKKALLTSFLRQYAFLRAALAAGVEEGLAVLKVAVALGRGDDDVVGRHRLAVFRLDDADLVFGDFYGLADLDAENLGVDVVRAGAQEVGLRAFLAAVL